MFETTSQILISFNICVLEHHIDTSTQFIHFHPSSNFSMKQPTDTNFRNWAISIYPPCFLLSNSFYGIAKFVFAPPVWPLIPPKTNQTYSNCCYVQRRVYLHVIHNTIRRKPMAVHRHRCRWEEPNVFLLAILCFSFSISISGQRIITITKKIIKIAQHCLCSAETGKNMRF